ncbi:hypothetical protein SELMODRAFT_420891 [Selaginella moellendorffii]|uniref:SEC63 domain-containing protein n=1 Tax=Selaginella moellendorffii TaxID=88036 RepID=D8SDG1_SELML|nr:hypothetical protein SELMODRAFT_420891 [Selaginella moellendorffii]
MSPGICNSMLSSLPASASASGVPFTRAKGSEAELLQLLSSAAEYDELPVRHNEAHFPPLELPISDYVTDTKSVLDQSIRILQAMVDAAANGGWLRTTIRTVQLLQMIMQAWNFLPRIDPSWRMRDQRLSEGDKFMSFALDIEVTSKSSTRSFLPQYSKFKEEGWWIVVGITSTWELFAMRRVSIPHKPSARNYLRTFLLALIQIQVKRRSLWKW